MVSKEFVQPLVAQIDANENYAEHIEWDNKGAKGAIDAVVVIQGRSHGVFDRLFEESTTFRYFPRKISLVSKGLLCSNNATINYRERQLRTITLPIP